VSRRWRNWCQNKVYEETKGADARDKVKRNGRSIYDDMHVHIRLPVSSAAMIDIQIQKPADVDATRIKSSLTSDGVLTVGASLHSPKHCRYHSPSSRCYTPSLSPSKSLPLPPPPPELKPGVPVFRDEAGGQRRLHLCVDVGVMFKPSDVTIQVYSSTLHLAV